jgi:hypothetical protein
MTRICYVENKAAIFSIKYLYDTYRSLFAALKADIIRTALTMLGKVLIFAFMIAMTNGEDDAVIADGPSIPFQGTRSPMMMTPAFKC